MTEAERYEKSVYRPNNKKGKKRNPQEEWMDLIQRAAGGNAAPDHLKQFLTNLAMLDNVPRKEKQFRNFTSNSLNHLRGGRGDTVGEVYKYLSNMRQTENDARKLVQEKEAATKKAEEERKQQEKEASAETLSSTDEQQQLPSAKKVTKTMKKIVKKEKGSIKFKLLRSRVSEALGLDKSMQKKLKKMLKSELESSDNKIRLEGKLVKLE